MDKVIFILFFISGLQMACGLTDQEYKKRLIIWNTTQRGKHSCIDGELDVYRDLAILPKTIYSEQKRVVFFAGLGGTGHHLYKQLMLVCAKHDGCEESTFHDFIWRQKGLDGGMWNPKSTQALNQSYCIVKSELQTIASAARQHGNREQPLVVSVNPVNDWGTKGASGEMSYPNFYMQNTKHTPDVWLLGAMSELTKVDFRFLVLLRSPWDVVQSVWRRFHAGSFRLLIKRFASAQKMLLEQLKRMHPDFYTCTYLPNAVEYAPAVEKLLFGTARLAKKPLEGKLVAAFTALVKNGPGTTLYPNHDAKNNSAKANLIAEKMEGTFDAIVHLCTQNSVYGHFRAIPRADWAKKERSVLT